jgi:type VI secretion system protein ImpJ
LDARNIPDQVLWSEGMLLSPQHFQLANHRLEQIVAYMAAATLPYRWGVTDLVVPPSSLAQGIFEVERIEAVMPDGMIVCHPLDDSQPLSRDLKPHFEMLRKGPGTIHLAVLAQRPGLKVDPDTNLGRYHQTTQSAVPDEFAQDRRIDVATLRPALHLILTGAGEDPPLKFSTLPLARVALEERHVVRARFAPPALAVNPQSELHRIVGDTIARVREKAVTRAEYLKSTGIGSFSLEAAQLRALVAPLPQLEAMIEQGQSHPYDLYLALTAAVGQLACITTLNVPNKMPTYHHGDPLPSFEALAGEINTLIDQLEERFDKFAFENLGDGRFRLELKASWLQEFLYVQAFAGPSQPLWQVEQWARHALIGDRDRMGQIREARALGAPRTLIERADKVDLVRSSDAVLIRIPLRTPGQPSGLQLGEHRTLEIQSEIPADADGRPQRVVLYVAKAVQKGDGKPSGAG